MVGIKLKDLKEAFGELETKPKTNTVPSKLITLGRVLQTLDGMNRRDALWVLRKAIKELGG